MSTATFFPLEQEPPGEVVGELFGWVIDDYDGAFHPATVRLDWSRTDPYAVRAVFRTAHAPNFWSPPVEWLLSRDLLHDGLLRGWTAGQGDVRVWTQIARAMTYPPDAAPQETTTEETTTQETTSEETTADGSEADEFDPEFDGEFDVVLELSGPSGSARVELSADRLAWFLAVTFALVPAGAESEHYDIDAAIAAWLDGESA